MRILVLITVLIISLSSCFSYKIATREYRDFSYPLEKRKAYVVNKNFKKEFKILQQSGLFDIVNDSTNSLKIQLHAMQKKFICGNGMMVWFCFAGQVPVTFPDTYHYRFDEINKEDTVSKTFEIKINTRYWFWDFFAVDRKKFTPKAGKVLAAGYYYNNFIAE